MTELKDKHRVVIAGGSGFLGISLATFLTEIGHDVTILSRKQPRVNGPWQFLNWDARTVGNWAECLQAADAVVNLTGRTVDCIKTPDHCDEILRSRVESTRVLGEAMRTIQNPPPVWVQMSTAHIYGDPPSVVCTESSAFGFGLAPIVGQAWEAEFNRQLLPQQRGVVLRTSFVVGRDRGAGGGAMSKLGWLARIGFGGTIGTGQQGMSWIHEADMNQIFHRAITNKSMSGVYIASAPTPVSQRDFMRTLRRAVGNPIGLPTFAWMVRIGAPLFLRTDPEIALYGRYVIPERLLAEGFQFRFSHLSDALADLI